MKKVALTRELHAGLKLRGYKYLLITDVQVICPKNMLYSMTLKPDKAIPSSMAFSCTGIDDTLVTGAWMRGEHGCEVFVEIPES